MGGMCWFCSHLPFKQLLSRQFGIYSTRLIVKSNDRYVFAYAVMRNSQEAFSGSNVQYSPSGQVHLSSSRCIVDNFSQPASNDEITQKINKLLTVTELLDIFHGMNADFLAPSHTSLATQRLVTVHYQSMCSVYSWLQTNIHVAQIQLRLCGPDTIWTFSKPVHLHPGYYTWLSMIERDYQAYSGDQLADALLAALYLGVLPEGKLVHKLLAETHKRLDTFGLKALAATSNALKALPGIDFVASKSVLKQMEVLLDATNVITGEEMAALSTVVVNTIKLMNGSYVHKLVAWLLQVVKTNASLFSNPDNLGSFLRMAHKLAMFPQVEKRLSVELIDLGVDACYESFARFDSANIAEICHSLKLSRRYDRELSRLIEERANDLLDDNCRLCDVSNLMYALTRNSPPSVILQFTGALHSRLMRSDDVDIIVLSNIADVLVDLPNVGVDLMELFQRRIVDRVDDIVMYVSRYNKIVKLLVRRRFVNRDLESKFTDRLLSHVERHDGIHMHSVSSVAAYLLPASRGALPPLFFERLLAAVPRWREPELYRLAIGVNSVRQPMTATMRRQLAQIHAALHANIGARLDTVDSLDYLYQLTLGWVVHNRYRDPTLTDRLMSMYARFSPNLADNVSAIKITQMFHSIGYHFPNIYDDIVRYIVKSAGSEDDSVVLWAVAACAKVGYLPPLGEDLLKLACSIYRKLIVQRDYKTALQLLYDVMIIQLYPENELSMLFTLEAIEDLEHYMTDNPQNMRVVERLMMELNRSVILECPQLDVPWFHEQYCNDNTVKDADETNMNTVSVRLRNEVHDVICEVLGGSQYVRKATYSPYYYEIDFQCVLDEKQRPVNVGHWHHAGQKQSCQKIAVYVLPESNYCYNSKQLIGQKQMQKRHLEIMDYKFVEIPYFDWFSMGLTDQQSKYDYIEAKLMK